MTAAVADTATDETVTNETVNTDADKAEEVEDITPFTAAMEAITLADAGDATSASVKAAQEVYGELNAKSKRAVRRVLKEQAEKKMLDDEFDESKRLILIRNYAAIAPGARSAGTVSRKSAKDKAIETFQTVHRAYQIAATLVQNIDGVDFDQIQPEQVDLAPAIAYAQWLENPEGDEPEADKDLKRAARVATGRGPNGQGRKPGNKSKEEAAEGTAVEAVVGE